MADRVAIVTNVTKYAGGPASEALAADGFKVLCHDPSFRSAEERAAYDGAHSGCAAAVAQEPKDLIAETLARFGRLDVLVSNDVFAATAVPVEMASIDIYRATIEALMVAPFRLAAAAADVMIRNRTGRIILVTSAAPLRPYPGYSMYASARSGANALAQALAKELGPSGIQVNAVAPNFLESETYFPVSVWRDNPKYAQRLKEMVPLQRLGRPPEVGALIAFLASGKSDFVTGQVIAFTGGWP
ncbi:SDR family oxidoreductase [uncultured Bradyrhizobium sp.]|uniref:SDR family oxidoreductase n=1 Tax=uncultured Bradyrhizobium sp. TaxID=199684 RepID=UPI0035CB5F6C